MTFVRTLYTIYGAILFIVIFLLLMPFFLLVIAIPALQKRHTHTINKVWAILFFSLIGLRIRNRYKKRFPKNQQYIICANHFSYLDIAVLGFSPVPFVFVGKSELAKIPLFGYMFRKLHITVDRGSIKGRYETFRRSKEALDKGYNLCIFPEGGILTKTPPRMTRFKDGAFRLAIEKQIPIIPVTIPHNWIILPDKSPLRLRHHKAHVVFHAPLSTEGLTLEDADELKQKVFGIIDEELHSYFPDENRQSNIKENRPLSQAGVQGGR
ncbi:lysophospholipid acyltransferase family protein [Roseivirga sp. BDSF3-8]|uniref:lysophospholipid acyltransferase family protein n=1 Tax=Roseivirga sp. BDSF3-8 TaxID=3241598 RepID=UPI003531E4BB